MNLIDTHVDTITTLLDNKQFLLDNTNHISLNKLSTFEKKGIYFAIWLSEERRKNSFAETINAINFYYNEIEQNKTLISHANNYQEFDDIFNSGKVASILGLEGGEAIEGNFDNLFTLYSMGVRLITLTWNNDNEIGSGVLGSDRGLTAFGKTFVKKLNDMNIILDVSHLNRKGFFDVIDLTQKPLLASHSNSYAIHSSKRNLFDDQLEELKNTKSYVSFTIHSPFINGTDNCNTNDILRHIDHLLNKLGEDFVSIGTDFDGTNFLPCEINNISDLILLYNLVKKTYNTEITNKIFYKNQLDFLKKVI